MDYNIDFIIITDVFLSCGQLVIGSSLSRVTSYVHSLVKYTVTTVIENVSLNILYSDTLQASTLE